MQTQMLRIIIVILLTLVVALYFYTDRQKYYYSLTAEPAIGQILTEVSGWKKQVLLRHLAPETLQTVSDEQLEALLALYRGFGNFRSVNELEFSRTVSAFSLIGEKRINYSGTANFDIGLVNVNITLVERSGFFLIYNFTLTRAADK
ncbi:hypothetical protein SAMN05216419_101019 [Nitrosomonas cryotolerans]|uniref:Uncharacterized protein n=2 Tax=Nitrosomonas cryotolerans TaxID=44575 RepID=A0A1N6FHC1_9PROT|nr:hypothetical protein [Nitrosomonas cryotolerans]SFP62734.1 hypothetical protein SAMN05216419_101019 [Nitrosomonas cryotolerans]SIN94637.1 hypothetical protein SAMN02743940_0251 [Nitrosomonas cryotolerans ATCC 49181]